MYLYCLSISVVLVKIQLSQGMVEIPFISSAPQNGCACSEPWPKFGTPCVVVSFAFSMVRGEMLLFVLYILVELWIKTVYNFFLSNDRRLITILVYKTRTHQNRWHHGRVCKDVVLSVYIFCLRSIFFIGFLGCNFI